MTFALFDTVLQELEENDNVTWQIVGGVFYYVVGRLLTTFAFAYFYGESWRIQGGIYGLPVVGFSADEATYALINSSSAVAIALFINVGALQRIHAWRSAPHEPLVRSRALSWTLVSGALLGQLYVGYLINQEKELELRNWAMLMIAAGVVIVFFYAWRSLHVVSNRRLLESLGKEVEAKKKLRHRLNNKLKPKKSSK